MYHSLSIVCLSLSFSLIPWFIWYNINIHPHFLWFSLRPLPGTRLWGRKDGWWGKRKIGLFEGRKNLFVAWEETISRCFFSLDLTISVFFFLDFFSFPPILRSFHPSLLWKRDSFYITNPPSPSIFYSRKKKSGLEVSKGWDHWEMNQQVVFAEV